MNSFDKNIKLKTAYHEVATPHHLWDGIEATLEEKKNRTPFLFWLMPLLAITTIVVAYQWSFENEPTNVDEVLVQEIVIGQENTPANKTTRVLAKGKANEPLTVIEGQNTKNIKKATPIINPIQNPTKISTAIQANRLLAKPENPISTPESSMHNSLKEEKPQVFVKPETASEAFGVSIETLAPLAALELKTLPHSPTILGCDAFKVFSKGKLFFEFQSQFEFYSRDLSSKTIGGDDLLTYRAESESHLTSYAAYGMAGYRQKNGFLFKTGIGYRTFRMRFDYDNPNDIQTVYHVTVDTIANTDGSITILYDTTNTEYIQAPAISHNNFVRTLEIPILLGYEYHAKKWYVGGVAGVGIRLASVQSGKVRLGEMEVANFGNNDLKLYDESLSFAMMGQLHAGYKFSKNWSLNMGMNYYLPLTSISAEDYHLNEQVKSIGFNLGLRYEL